MPNEFIIKNGLISQGNIIVTGSIIATGGITISGSVASASYASNAELLDGLDSTVFTLTSSFAAQTASFTAFTSSINLFSASVNTFSSSILTYTSSLNAKTSSFATTGSNTFIGTETISGSLVISGSGTPFTLNTDTLEITGSLLVTGSATFTGSVNFSSGLTGSLLGTSSYANNANLLDGLDSTVFITTASFAAQTASFTAFTASINTFSASILSYTSSLNAKTSSFATTGSNIFIGNQTITGSLLQSGSFTSTGTITAQMLVVQTITSSVLYSSGSNVFGNNIANTQVFSGSLYQTGSLAFFAGNVGIGTTSPQGALEVIGLSYFTRSSQSFLLNPNYGGSGTHTQLQVIGNMALAFATNGDNERMRITSGGNVGIGTTSPSEKLDVFGKIQARPLANSSSGNYWYMIGSVTDVTNFGVANGIVVESPSLNSYAMTFGTQGSYITGITEKMRITSGGNVGIGTTSPDIFSRGDALNIGISATGSSDNMALSLNAGGSAGRGAQIYMGQGGTRHFTLSSNSTETTIGTTTNTSFRLSSNDTTRIFISGSGNVGIGTTSPQSNLHVYGTSGIFVSYDNGTIYSEFIQNTSGGAINLKNSAGTSNSILRSYGDTQLNTNIGNVGIGTTSPSSIRADKVLHLYGAYSGLTIESTGVARKWNLTANYYGSTAALEIWDETAGAVHTVFQAGGNVGIGTTAPGRKLVVKGDTNISGSIVMGGITDSGGLGTGVIYMLEGQGIAWYNSAFNAGRASIQGTSAGHIILAPTANVGIGTTSPVNKLHVVDTNAMIRVSYDSGGDARYAELGHGALIGYAGATNNWLTIGFSGGGTPSAGLPNGGVQISTNGSARMTVSKGGDVGIGTDVPQAKLDVRGNIYANDGSSTAISVYNAGSIRGKMSMTGNEGDLTLYGSSANATVYLSAYYNSYFNAGNVGIGTTAPTTKLQVVGETDTSILSVSNTTNGQFQSRINANAVNSQGACRWRTYARGIVATGTGTKLNIPFYSQGNLNIVTIARVLVCSADFNSSYGGAAQFMFSVGSLNALSNLQILSSGGNYSSATTSGMNVVVTLGSFVAAYIVIEYLTPEPSYSIDLGNITLTS